MCHGKRELNRCERYLVSFHGTLSKLVYETLNQSKTCIRISIGVAIIIGCKEVTCV